MSEDIRWKQRFKNYKKARAAMTNALDLARSRKLSDLEKQGLIKGFELAFELAWNVMKDYLEEQGITDIIGSKNAIRHALRNGLIDDGQVWMDMAKIRAVSSRAYDEATAEKIFAKIAADFREPFASLERKMESLEG